MAAKTCTKFKLPPMYPRVVAADELTSPDRRTRFFAEMAELDASGVVPQVMRFVRAERGAWLREGHAWPKWVRKIAEFEFHRASVLEELVRECYASGACLRAGGKEIAKALQARALDLLQRVLDAVFEEGKELHRRNAEAMAGLSGFVAGPAMSASSGVEAAGHLAWCVRRAVRGIENPFWPYVISAQSKRVMRKQVGRDEPRSPEELLPDDVAILRACEHGALSAKEVEARSDACGFKMTASHASKRKGDLEGWALLLDARRFQIAAKGQEWLRLVRDRMQTRA